MYRILCLILYFVKYSPVFFIREIQPRAFSPEGAAAWMPAAEIHEFLPRKNSKL
jgi:hypothetical protein